MIILAISELICSYKPTLCIPMTFCCCCCRYLCNAGVQLYYKWISIIICFDGYCDTWFLSKQANRKTSIIDNNFSNNLFASNVRNNVVYIDKWSPGWMYLYTNIHAPWFEYWVTTPLWMKRSQSLSLLLDVVYYFGCILTCYHRENIHKYECTCKSVIQGWIRNNLTDFITCK